MEFDEAYFYNERTILGRGADGVVYPGVRKCDNKLVAIKKMPNRKFPQFELPHEVKVMKQLDGLKHAVTFIDMFIKEDNFLIVMERDVHFKVRKSRKNV